MKKIKLTTTRLFVLSFLLRGLMKNLLFLLTQIRIRPLIVKTALAVILALSAITQVNAQGNPAAIDVKEFSFTPSTVDVTNSSQNVTVTVRVTDTERDVSSITIFFRSRAESEIIQVTLGSQNRISGDGRDGVYRAAAVFPQYSKAGIWVLSAINVFDGINNKAFVTADFAARGFATDVQVVNNNEEIPPEISEFSISPATVSATSGSRSVTVTLRAKDATLGVNNIFLEFYRPGDLHCDYYDDDCYTAGFTIYLTSANRISGDAKDGVYRVVITIPHNHPAGIYDVSVSASDLNYNYVSLAPADLAARGFPSELRIVRSTPFDFDGDSRADLSVFRPSDRTWYLNRSQAGFSAAQFGLSTDKITPADFDGDGKTDVAVFRDGFWYWLNSSDGNFNAIQFGLANDIPQPADFSGDGRAELAVYRGGIWYTLNLANNQFQAVQFGIASDKPVAADYDGDGKADYAVVRQGGGVSIWYILGSTQGFYGFQFGTDTDKPVPADYDGDGKTDAAVFRPSERNWYILRSASNSLQVVNWGLASDTLVPADYDGDGRADIAVYRDGIWYIRETTDGIKYINFGLSSDIPTN